MAVKIIFPDGSYRLRSLTDINKVWRIFDVESQTTSSVIFFNDCTLWNKTTYSYGDYISDTNYKVVTCQHYDEFITAFTKKKKIITHDYEKEIWTFIDDCSESCSCDDRENRS